MYECENGHCVAALQLLQQLPQLSDASLGLHSCQGSELGYCYAEIDGWDELLELPPLGSLTALTNLWLAGLVQPPSDFSHLSQLRRLTIAGAYSGDGDFEWAMAPLSGLLSLTRIDLIQGYHGMALPGGLPDNHPYIAFALHVSKA